MNKNNNQKTDSQIDQKAGEKLEAFFKYLTEEKNYHDEALIKVGQTLTQLVTDKTMVKIILELSEENKELWNKFLETKPTPASQLVKLNDLYKKQTKKGIEHVQNEIMILVIDAMKEQLNIAQDLAKKIGQLSDKDAQKASQLIKQGKECEADKIINQSV